MTWQESWRSDRGEEKFQAKKDYSRLCPETKKLFDHILDNPIF
jgi:hypothetical protein